LANPGVRVIPVLVQGAAMPLETDLPDDLRPFARRNVVAIRGASWDKDVERIVSIARSGSPSAHFLRLSWPIGGAVAALAALALGYGFFAHLAPSRTRCDLTGAWVKLGGAFTLKQSGTLVELRSDASNVGHYGSGAYAGPGQTMELKLVRVLKSSNCRVNGRM
jgi:hypothetical protein